MHQNKRNSMFVQAQTYYPTSSGDPTKKEWALGYWVALRCIFYIDALWFVLLLAWLMLNLLDQRIAQLT